MRCGALGVVLSTGKQRQLRQSAGSSNAYVARAYCYKLPLLFAALVSCAVAQPVKPETSDSAQDFIREVINTELKAANDDHTHWSYKKTTQKSGRKEEQVIIETREGELERLLAINGQPLTPVEKQRENERIQDLLQHPSKQQQRRKDQQKVDQQMTRMLKLLPRALLFSYGERRGNSIELRFRPNPDFHPHSHEASVLHALGGQMWINSREKRFEEVNGRLVHEVRFIGGIGGHLYKGGEFMAKQIEVVPGHWEVIAINIQIRGKALFFKGISVQQIESRSDFHEVPANLTLAQAAKMLLSKAVAQARH